MNCLRYPKQSCGNCVFSCVSNENWCKDWQPSRGSHPCEANACEADFTNAGHIFEGKCSICQHNPMLKIIEIVG